MTGSVAAMDGTVDGAVRVSDDGQPGPRLFEQQLETGAPHDDEREVVPHVAPRDALIDNDGGDVRRGDKGRAAAACRVDDAPLHAHAAQHEDRL